MDGSNNMDRRIGSDLNSNPVSMSTEEEQFQSSEGFQGATSALDWDALATHGSIGSKQAALSKWERDSLYVKFDPLVNSRPSVVGDSSSFIFKAPLPIPMRPLPAVPTFSNANTANKNDTCNSSFEFDDVFKTPMSVDNAPKPPVSGSGSPKPNLFGSPKPTLFGSPKPTDFRSPKPTGFGSPNGNISRSPTNFDISFSGDGDAERSFASAMEASAVLESLDDVEEAVLRGKSPETVDSEYSSFSPVKTDVGAAASHDNYQRPNSTSPAPPKTRSPLNESGLCAAFFGQTNLNSPTSPKGRASKSPAGSPQVAQKVEDEATISSPAQIPPSASSASGAMLEPTLVSRLTRLEEVAASSFSPNTSLTDFVNMLDPFKPSPARISPQPVVQDTSRTPPKGRVSDISNLMQRMSLESTFVESFESSGASELQGLSPATVVSCNSSQDEKSFSVPVDESQDENNEKSLPVTVEVPEPEVDEEAEEQLEKMRRIARLKDRISKQVIELEAKEKEYEEKTIEDQKVLDEIRSQAKLKQEEYEAALRTKERVILERDQARDDVQTAETGFAEILMMYENMKGVQARLERNHEILQIREQDYYAALTRRDGRDVEVRRKLSHVVEAMHADFEIKVRDRETENVKLRARHRMSEMKTQQLESAIHQVDRENEKLRVLCDELVNA